MFKKDKQIISNLKKEIEFLEENKDLYIKTHFDMMLEVLTFQLKMAEGELNNKKRIMGFSALMLTSFIFVLLSTSIDEPYSSLISILANSLSITAILTLAVSVKEIEDKKKQKMFYAMYALPIALNVLGIIFGLFGLVLRYFNM